MNKCPQCGQTGASRFCPNCGQEMQRVCSQCGSLGSAQSKFCSDCGAPVQPAGGTGSGVSGSNVKIGDIGVLRGSIDASTQVNTTIGSQTNISGPVTVQVSAGKREPTAEEWLERGLQALRGKQYGAASDSFRQAIQAKPALADAYFYLALAQLQGHRPKLVSLATARSVESQLQTATQIDKGCTHAYLLWALLKQDAYVMNGMSERTPTVAQLLAASRSIDRGYVQEILDQVQAPGNRVWELIRSALQ